MLNRIHLGFNEIKQFNRVWILFQGKVNVDSYESIGIGC